jgi:hypothetical protein
MPTCVAVGVHEPDPRDLDVRVQPALLSSMLVPPGVKTFDELFAELADKARTRPEGSGTVAALDAGVHAIGKKVVEEAAEAWMAAEHESTSAPPRRSASCSTTPRC